jgi:hypothetical protein
MDPNITDQASLLQAIQQYAAMLAQQKQQQDAMGVNPQIIQGQSNVDLARVQAAQGILNQPQAAPGQNWEVDPNGANNLMAQRLLSQGAPVPAAPRQQASYGNPLLDMLRPTDWETAAFNSQNRNNYNRDLSTARANGETRMLTPEEMQKRDLAMQQAPLDAASGLLSGTKPQQAFDPALFGQLAGVAGQQGVASTNLKGHMFDAQATQQAALMNSQTQKDIASGNNATNLATAKLQADAVAGKPRQPTVYEMKAQEAKDTALQGLSTASDVANQFKPEFFLTSTKVTDEVRDAFAKKGIPIGADNQAYDQFKLGLDDMATQYIKLVGGPRGFSNEKAKEQILKPIVNETNSPEDASAAMVEMLARFHVAAHHASIVADEAAAAGQRINTNDPATKEKIRNDTEKALKGGEMQAARDAVYKVHPNLKPGNSGADLTPHSPEELAALRRATVAKQGS